MSDGGLEEVRRRLAGRVDDCWDRLEDVVAELTALHGIDDDEILERVRDALDGESGR